MPLPDEILAELVDCAATPEECLPPRPLARLYRQALKASGLTRKELRQRLEWGSDGNKVLRHLDSLLDGTCKVPGFEARFVAVMNLPETMLEPVQAEDAAWLQRVTDHQRRARFHHHYRSHGPYLMILPNENWQHLSVNTRYLIEITRRISLEMAHEPHFDPPAPEAMGHTIATSAESITRDRFSR